VGYILCRPALVNGMFPNVIQKITLTFVYTIPTGRHLNAYVALCLGYVPEKVPQI